MDSKFLKERFSDLLKQCEKSSKPQFLGFLSEEEAAFATQLLGNREQIVFFGGYDNASRVYIGVFPSGILASERALPINSVTVNYRVWDKLSHRDFLGAVLALGLKREAIGDILLENGRTVIFCSPSAARLITNELKTVGRVGVKVNEGHSLPLPESSKITEFSVTVSSLRLDCVLACVCSVSRSTANALIEERKVSINSQPCDRMAKTVSCGDKITVRGIGKFTISSLDGETRKGRLKITIQKYV